MVLGGVWRLWVLPEHAGPIQPLGRMAAVVAVVLFNGRLASEIVERTLAMLGDSSEKTATRQRGQSARESVGEQLGSREDAVREDPGHEVDGPDGAGRLIGILERYIVLGLVSGNQWGAVGLVLTAKSIARFKKMAEQAFAEIYLVGTMTSVLIAMASGALLRIVLG